MDKQFDPAVVANQIMQGYLYATSPLEDMLYVKGKVAIVTGGTSGLGFCVAQRLCQGGAKVAPRWSSPAPIPQRARTPHRCSRAWATM